MLAPTLLALAVAPFGPFTKPIVVAQPARLAITPALDGKLQPEEWDELSDIEGGKTYFQWEPGTLHVAATVPMGRDVLISADMRADGWLMGQDNLEVRVRYNNGTPEVQTRVLDGTQVEGPVWRDGAAFQASSRAAAAADAGMWTLELTMRDPGKGMLIRDPARRMGIRIDAVPTEEGSYEAFLPRVMTMISLGLDRASAAPVGLTFKPEYKGRTVVPGESARVRLTFSGKPEAAIKRIEMRTEGLSRDVTGTVGLPFPAFDNKNRAFVDYETKVGKDAALGYRVIRATVTDADGKESVVQSSFEVAQAVDFEIVPSASVTAGQKAKLVVYVRSNTLKRVDGVISLAPPAGWQVLSGNDEPFIIYSSRGSVRKVFEVMIPADAKGPTEIKARAVLGSRLAEGSLWLMVP